MDPKTTAIPVSVAGEVVESEVIESTLTEEAESATASQTIRTPDWDNVDNEQNPRNWQRWRKWTIVTVVAYIELLTHLVSLMFAPGISQMRKDFGSNNDYLATFAMTVYVLGFGVGPLLFSPLSEVYGRTVVCRLCGIVFLVLTIACASAASLPQLIAFRFFAGCFGAAPVAIGGAIVADLFALETRGAAMAVYHLGPVLGNLLGPPIGGVIIHQQGWRWVFWVTAILAGFATVCAFTILRETHHYTILRRLTARNELDADTLVANVDSPQKPKAVRALTRALKRPFRLFFLSPVVICISFLTVLQIGIQNLLFASLGSIFEQYYGFNASMAGLVYLGITIGFVIAAFTFGKTSDRLQANLAKRYDGEIQPEFRLPAMIIGIPIMSAGLLWYGWTIAKSVHWILPVLSLPLIGIGLTLLQLSNQTYLVDAFTEFAASALAAGTVAKSIGGSVVPLAGPALYTTLGLGWGNTVLALLNLAFCVGAICLFIYGKKLREKFPVKDL